MGQREESDALEISRRGKPELKGILHSVDLVTSRSIGVLKARRSVSSPLTAYRPSSVNVSVSRFQPTPKAVEILRH